MFGLVTERGTCAESSHALELLTAARDKVELQRRCLLPVSVTLNIVPGTSAGATNHDVASRDNWGVWVSEASESDGRICVLLNVTQQNPLVLAVMGITAGSAVVCASVEELSASLPGILCVGERMGVEDRNALCPLSSFVWDEGPPALGGGAEALTKKLSAVFAACRVTRCSRSESAKQAKDMIRRTRPKRLLPHLSPLSVAQWWGWVQFLLRECSTSSSVHLGLSHLMRRYVRTELKQILAAAVQSYTTEMTNYVTGSEKICGKRTGHSSGQTLNEAHGEARARAMRTFEEAAASLADVESAASFAVRMMDAFQETKKAAFDLAREHAIEHIKKLLEPLDTELRSGNVHCTTLSEWQEIFLRAVQEFRDTTYPDSSVQDPVLVDVTLKWYVPNTTSVHNYVVAQGKQLREHSECLVRQLQDSIADLNSRNATLQGEVASLREQLRKSESMRGASDSCDSHIAALAAERDRFVADIAKLHEMFERQRIAAQFMRVNTAEECALTNLNDGCATLNSQSPVVDTIRRVFARIHEFSSRLCRLHGLRATGTEEQKDAVFVSRLDEPKVLMASKVAEDIRNTRAAMQVQRQQPRRLGEAASTEAIRSMHADAAEAQVLRTELDRTTVAIQTLTNSIRSPGSPPFDAARTRTPPPMSLDVPLEGRFATPPPPISPRIIDSPGDISLNAVAVPTRAYTSIGVGSPAAVLDAASASWSLRNAEQIATAAETQRLLEAVRQRAEKSEAECERGASERLRLEEHVQMLEEALGDSKRQSFELQTSLESCSAMAQQQGTRITELEATKDALTRKLEQLEGLHREVQAELQAARQKIADYVTETARLNKQRETLNETVAQLQAAVSGTELAAAELERKYKLAMSDYEHVMVRLNSLSVTLEDRESAIRDLRSVNAKLQSELDAAKIQLGSMRVALEAESSSAKQYASELQVTEQALAQEREERRAVCDSYERQISDLLMKMDTITAQGAEDYGRVKGELAQRRQELEASLAQCREQCDHLREESQQRLADLEAERARTAHLSDDVQALTELRNRLQDELKVKVQTLEKMKISYAVAEDDSNVVRQSMEMLTTELKQSEAVRETLQDALRRNEAHLAEFRRQVGAWGVPASSAAQGFPLLSQRFSGTSPSRSPPRGLRQGSATPLGPTPLDKAPAPTASRLDALRSSQMASAPLADVLDDIHDIPVVSEDPNSRQRSKPRPISPHVAAVESLIQQSSSIETAENRLAQVSDIPRGTRSGSSSSTVTPK